MLTLAQSSMRLGPMGGCLGIDMNVVISIAQALGYDAAAVIELIGSSQVTIAEKLNQK